MTPKRTSRQFDDHGPGLLQVEHRSHVRRVGIAGEQDVPGTARQDRRTFTVLRAHVTVALECGFHRDGGIEEPIGLYGALVVLFVLNASRRFRNRVAVPEFVFLSGALGGCALGWRSSATRRRPVAGGRCAAHGEHEQNSERPQLSSSPCPPCSRGRIRTQSPRSPSLFDSHGSTEREPAWSPATAR